MRPVLAFSGIFFKNADKILKVEHVKFNKEILTNMNENDKINA